MKKKQTLLLGAHMSIAGGPEKALERGESIGCTAIQIFTKSNRQWKSKPLTDTEINNFIQYKKTSSIQSIVAHASYLINIGSSSKEIEHKSVNALKEELMRCEKLSIPYLVLHPGSAIDDTPSNCMKRIANNLNSIYKNTHKTTILLELMAGQGSVVGSTFEELAEIYSHISVKRNIGFCFDTCHAFAAGYDFSTPKKYTDMWNQFDSILGIHNLKAIHMNDSKKERGSHVDRHEGIGKGKMGLEPFKLLMNDERFFNIPKLLETPKADLQEDKHNIGILESLMTEKTKRLIS